MLTIDYKKYAEDNGLTPEAFKKEMMRVCACLMSMELDGQDSKDAIKYSCSDDTSKIELYCRRVTK